MMSLNTSVMTGSRIFGPALAALFAGVLGTGWCFVLNGVSFLALLWALIAIDPSPVSQRHRRPPATPRSATGCGRCGPTRAAPHRERVRAIVRTFALNYTVSIPLLIRDQLHAPDAMFGWILSVTSVGSVFGALMVARLHVAHPIAVRAGARDGGDDDGDGVLDEHRLTFAIAVPFGAGVAAFIAASNSIFAERTSPDMRGVLALGAVLFLGSAPIGAPITGSATM